MQFHLADLFENVADHVPDREAVVYGDRRLTFRQFDDRATQLAHYLQSQGIGPGDRVGLYLYNCVAASRVKTLVAGGFHAKPLTRDDRATAVFFRP